MGVDLSKPIDREDPSFKPLFQDLQGNILKGHGRNHSIHIFLEFASETLSEAEILSIAKEWIRSFATKHVTSAKKQFDEMDDFRKFRIPGSLFANLFLTYEGYKKLDVDAPKDPRFIAGMKASREHLADPDPDNWDEGYKGEMHVYILLAHDDESELNNEARRILRQVRTFAKVVAGERGRVMRNEDDNTIEHFGYVDGRSQPLFLKEDIKKARDQEPGTELYNPAAPPDLVLVSDKNGAGAGDYSFGSYLVFRKLEQDVRGFKELEHELADQLGLTGDDEELAGALVIGRFEDGTPVFLQKTDGLTDPIPNNFNFEADPDGRRCPIHAHIRKVNPRGETVRTGKTEKEEREHRIARRGITYGERLKEPKDEPEIEELPSEDVGLLFLCFQSDIKNQFEFMQKSFANHEDFLWPGTGIDPVIGQVPQQQPYPAKQRWPKTWDSRVKRPFSFHGFVTLKGGEYFFAPSISALQHI